MSLMTSDKPKRVKLTFDVPEHTRRALASFASLEGMTTGEAIERLVDTYLPEFAEKAKAAISRGDEAPPKGRRPHRD